MKYTDFEKMVKQQGTQCAANLMSSAIMEVQVPGDAPTILNNTSNEVTNALLDAFDVTTKAELCVKLNEIGKQSGIPVIKLVYNSSTSRCGTIVRCIETTVTAAGAASAMSINWIYNGNSKTITL